MDERVEVIVKLRLSGRAVRDAAIKMRKGPEDAARSMIEIGKHFLDLDSTEKVEFKETLVST